MPQPLSDLQARVLDFLREWFDNESHSPTLEEIGRGVGGRRPQDVRAAVVALAKKGYVTRGYHQPRSLRLVRPRDGAEPATFRLAVKGTIAAGLPIETFDGHAEHVWVADEWARSPDSYVLRVKGDSMIGDGILEGDLVVVQPADDARDGQTVVAMLADGSVTLKKFFRRAGYVRLEPANPTMGPIVVPSVAVQGIVVAVLRKLES